MIITAALVLASLSANADVVRRTSQGYTLGNTVWPTIEALKAEADKGIPKAMYAFGWALDKGIGIAENELTATGWYEKCHEEIAKLANAGDVDAMLAMGDMCMEGDGVNENKKASAEWFRKAAETGSAEGMYQLAECYIDGDGVPEDKVQAAKLYKAAADKGHVNAKKKLLELQQGNDD